MLSAWKGQSPFAGNFLFRADRTYERTAHGPGAEDTAGVWKVRWDALPPTLVLTCKASELPEEVGKVTEVKLIRLNDENLAILHATEMVDRFARVKK